MISNDMFNELASIRNEILKFKTSQSTTNDSVVLYTYRLVITPQSPVELDDLLLARVQFIPENANCVAWLSTDGIPRTAHRPGSDTTRFEWMLSIHHQVQATTVTVTVISTSPGVFREVGQQFFDGWSIYG